MREGTVRATFGVIVGNRGFFPDHLARSGREEMLTAIGIIWIWKLQPAFASRTG